MINLSSTNTQQDTNEIENNVSQTQTPSSSNSEKGKNPIENKEIKYIIQKINLFENLKNSNYSNNGNLNFISHSYIPNYNEYVFISIYKSYENEELIKNKNLIDELNLSNKECNNIQIFDCIGYLSTLDKVFKDKNNEINDLLKNKLKTLNQFYFRWRKIKGDGNCFYRAIIFAYIEDLILKKNLFRLRDLICDINEKFKDDRLMDKLIINKINKKNVILYMLLIYFSLSTSNGNNTQNENLILRAYSIFIKCVNNYKDFDYGLILYLKYLIFIFIRKNEDKCLTKDFPIILGNLLPSEYETEDGIFLFNKFYNEYLLNLYREAEKIIIYITPFVLDINLNILIFEESNRILDNMKFINFENDFDDNNISILLRGNHYDLSYNEKFVKQFYNYLKIFEYNEKVISMENNMINDDNSFSLFPIEDNNLNNSNLNKKDDINNSNDNYIIYNEGVVGDKESKNKQENNNKNNTEKKKMLLKKENKENKCLNCQKIVSKYNTNKFKLCTDCLQKELFLKMTQLYIDLLKKNKNKINEYKISNLNSTDLIEFYIQNQKTFLNDILQILNKDLNDDNIKNKILDEIISQVCSFCYNSKFPKSKKLPCNCSFCNENCLKKYLSQRKSVFKNKKNSNNNIFEYFCFCGNKYNYQQLEELIKICDKIQLEDFKNEINKYINYNCCCCGNNKNDILNHAKIIFEVGFNDNSFKHYLCSDCLNKKKIQIKSTINCLYCNCFHVIESISKMKI